jgi:hypothetical protein
MNGAVLLSEEETIESRDELTAKTLAVVGLIGIAIVHLIDSVGTYSETRYIFWLYVALIVGCVVQSAVLLFAHRLDAGLAWSAVVVLGLAPLVGYVLSRSTGLPGDGGDIGNWSEPLGLVSMFVEALVIVLASWRVSVARRATAPIGHAALPAHSY